MRRQNVKPLNGTKTQQIEREGFEKKIDQLRSNKIANERGSEVETEFHPE
jgi:hypothetical protein